MGLFQQVKDTKTGSVTQTRAKTFKIKQKQLDQNDSTGQNGPCGPR